MRKLLAWLLRGYMFAAAYVLALGAVAVLALLWSGSLSAERLSAAFRALRGSSELPPAPPPALPPPRRSSDAAEREAILERKEQDLRKLEERALGRLSQIGAEQEALESRRRAADDASVEAKRALDELARSRNDAELAANVPILSRMEAPAIIGWMKGWDDASFLRHLRALRPGKAAEVLEALQSDPQFEEEFRRVPSDAPPGTRSRAERLSEEMKKTP